MPLAKPRFAAWAGAAALLSACASTNEPGWTGTNATPFDSAKARCQIETQTIEGEAFETCMAALGWRRRE
jgi:hypothetical protein